MIKKITNCLSASAFLLILLQSFEVFDGNKRKVDGTEPGYTGSPGDNYNNCTACHGGTATPIEGWITSNIPASGFVPGQVYTITATNSEVGATRFGFSVSPQTINGDLLGEMIITDTLTTKLVGNNKYITYRKDGIAGVDFRSWSFNWKAPDATVNEVVFYGAFNSNFDGHKDGDKTFLSELKVYREGFASVQSKLADQAKLLTFPNPAQDNLSIEFEQILSGESSIELQTINGQEIKTLFKGVINSGTYRQTFNVSDLEAGFYIVRISSGTQVMNQKITVLR